MDELAAEQAHLDRAYEALAAMRDRTEAAVAIAGSDARAGEVDAYATEAHLRRRLRELEVDVPGLAFGRIDPGHHIGRRHVEVADGDVLVVDWRAPVATAFYRATPADPQGLRLRRRFATTGARIDALFDEDFDDPDSIDAAHGGVPDPLLAELERARTGEMRDIVATIAAEQDVVIRAPIERALVVQGGPGTGKTAVGLHRAAFLLYEHRQRLVEQGVLVVGPNPTFLRYIAQVLPSLGETSVRQATVAGLVGAATAGAPAEGDERAALLGDARLAAVVDRALGNLTEASTGADVLLATAWGPATLRAADVAEARAEVAARGVPHDVGRGALRTRLVRLVRQALEVKRGDLVAGAADLEADLRRRGDLAKVLDRAWPAVSGPALARRLLTSRTALAAAADGLLGEAEQRLLVRRAARKLGDEAWTVPELVVVDECRARVEGVARTYGHVVVDEAQDLSAMAFRAVARRCPSGSLTILGDLAQATAPGAQSSWLDVLGHLELDASVELAELTLGYRVPAAILDWANRLLAAAAPGVTPARSVRGGGREPAVLAGADPAAVATELAGRHTSVGVVSAGRVADGPYQVVGPTEAKGLEFDAVVVVEPAAIVAAAPDEAAGLRLLYVALTRAVQELAVVHDRPLPEALRLPG